MSTPDSPFDGVSTDQEFHRALSDLTRAARANDVDVKGGWDVDARTGHHDLGIEIYRVVRGDD